MESLVTTEHLKIVKDLKNILDKNPKMIVALEASLLTASISAKKSLNSDLYNALNDEFKGNAWPLTVQKYYDFLDLFARTAPNESDDPNYPNAWKSTDTANGYNQKVYDILCHFYWLIDQKIPDTNISMQSFDAFSEWLVAYAKDWGSFLNTPESLSPESLASFKKDPGYNYPLYALNEPTWNSFNDFFYRQFNNANVETGISPLRPIAVPHDNTVITAPADCTFKAKYSIDSFGNVLDSNAKKTRITFKNTHTIGNVNELLAQSQYAEDFYNGTFVHYFLGPFDYHRFHTPIHGKVLEIKDIPGKVYLDVNMTDDGQFDAPDSATDGYEFVQARGLITVDGGPEVGKVAILPIGMAQVSGVDMYTDLQGGKVVKGQEFGKFKFGGSDIIMLFENTPNLYLFENDPGLNPIHFQYGQVAAYLK